MGQNERGLQVLQFHLFLIHSEIIEWSKSPGKLAFHAKLPMYIPRHTVTMVLDMITKIKGDCCFAKVTCLLHII